MRRLIFGLLACLVAGSVAWAAPRQYESVAGDLTATRIYTLPNGLKVYLSVNKDKPRISALIAVRTGSRNDPAETTGLAHYLEHLMFKGTESSAPATMQPKCHCSTTLRHATSNTAR